MGFAAEPVSRIDRPDEIFSSHQLSQPSAAPADAHVGPPPTQTPQRQAGLFGVELPGMEIEHRHRRTAYLVRLRQRFLHHSQGE